MQSILGLRRRTTHRSVSLESLRRYAVSRAAPIAAPAPALALARPSSTPSTVTS